MGFTGLPINQQDLLQQIATNTRNEFINNSPFMGSNPNVSVGVYNCVLGGITSAFFVDCDNSNGSNWFNFNPALATTCSIVSSSSADTLGSSGIGSLLITGVDASFNLQSETITMNGTNAVSTQKVWYIINNSTVLSSGNNIQAVGNITCYNATQNLFKIISGFSNIYSSKIAIPSGFTYNFDAFEFSCGGNTSAIVKLMAKPNGLPIQDTQILVVGQGNTLHNGSGNILGAVPEKTIVNVQVEAVGSSVATVSGFAPYYIVRNSYLNSL